ncbi:MAG: spoIVFB [Clostridia bacterium]|nr:spoIVFB [Clostridia bacterium]
MILKTKFCRVEIEIIFIFLIFTSIISNTAFKFLYYFFACYLFILFHELMHIFVGNILNKKLIKIKLSISGVCATFEKDKYIKSKYVYIKNIIIYLSGPFSNLILAYIFKNNIMIREINIFLALLNLLPIFPLDGYNIILNILNIFFPGKKIDKSIDNICNIFLVILVIISIYQIKEYYSFSLLIFSLYVFVLKINKSNE